MEKVIRVGLNGFGRIGRCLTRIAQNIPEIEIKAINTSRSRPDILAYLLKYDSVYRTLNKKVSSTSNSIIVDDRQIACFNYQNPQDIPWQAHDIDVVIDCTGMFETRAELSKHLRSSVKKVILTAPSKDATIPHVVLGVNDEHISFKDADIVSNASCTTNCAAIMFKILNDQFGVMSGFLTTIHSYTSSQQLLDNRGDDFTRSRAAPLSIIPSTTGAAKSIAKIIPDLKDKIDGISIRVPTPTVSYTDISCIVEKTTSTEEINEVFKLSTKKNLGEYLDYCDIELVSADFTGNTHSCIFDASYTTIMPNNLVKVFGWYDNEWGYSSRVIDLVAKLRSAI